MNPGVEMIIGQFALHRQGTTVCVMSIGEETAVQIVTIRADAVDRDLLTVGPQ